MFPEFKHYLADNSLPLAFLMFLILSGAFLINNKPSLVKRIGLPLMFSEGSGLSSKVVSVSDSDVAKKVLQDAYGIKLNYKESISKDTQMNAYKVWALLSKQAFKEL